MRIRWAIADPTAQARRIAAALDADVVAEGTGWAVDMAGDDLVLVGAGPAAERLTIDDDCRRAGARPPGELVASDSVRPGLVAVGLATVDRERFARDAGWDSEPLPPDELLGAFVERVPGTRLLLMEPSTEGRLAGLLARSGEGPAVVYLRTSIGDLEDSRAAVAALGGHPSRIAVGPFGPEFLLDAVARWGPHAMIVAPGGDPAGTMRA
jgi:hypothetical protein